MSAEGKGLVLGYRRFTLRYLAHSHLSVGGTIGIPNCIIFFWYIQICTLARAYYCYINFSIVNLSI